MSQAKDDLMTFLGIKREAQREQPGEDLESHEFNTQWLLGDISKLTEEAIRNIGKVTKELDLGPDDSMSFIEAGSLQVDLNTALSLLGQVVELCGED